MGQVGRRDQGPHCGGKEVRFAPLLERTHVEHTSHWGPGEGSRWGGMSDGGQDSKADRVHLLHGQHCDMTWHGVGRKAAPARDSSRGKGLRVLVALRTMAISHAHHVGAAVLLLVLLCWPCGCWRCYAPTDTHAGRTATDATMLLLRLMLAVRLLALLCSY